MKVLYVCSAGARRSATLALYSNHFKSEYGLDTFDFASAAIDADKRKRDLEKRLRRLAQCEQTRGGKYKSLVSRLREGNNDIHPRMGVLLLEDGVPAVVDQRMLIFTPELAQTFDLVLAVETQLKERIRELSHSNGTVQTVKEYLGYPDTDHDIADVKRYFLPFIWYQIRRDRTLRDTLKDISKQVLATLSSRQYH